MNQKVTTFVVFTTGQIGKACKVAPRTVGKWHDSGALKGHRLPGGRDRRFPLDSVVSFLFENGMETHLNALAVLMESKKMLLGPLVDLLIEQEMPQKELTAFLVMHRIEHPELNPRTEDAKAA